MPHKRKVVQYQTIIEKPHLYLSSEEAQNEWDTQRWPNFTAKEIACPLTDEVYIDPTALDYLQAARNLAGKPFIINSGHRSVEHNKAVGGRPNSAHLQIAFDISFNSTNGQTHDHYYLQDWLSYVGFNRFGLYETFIHADTRLPRVMWYGPEDSNAREVWKNIWTRKQPSI